jgi:hypothetical protein
MAGDPLLRLCRTAHTTLAEVHYDSARCHARDLVDDLEDDEVLRFTEAG